MCNVKKLFFLFIASASLAFASDAFWAKDFEVAKKEAINTNRFLVLFFSGSSVEEEIIRKEDFQEAVKPFFVFFKVDVSNEKDLKENYNVRSSPALVIVHPQKGKIASLEYFLEDSTAYSKRLKDAIEQYKTIEKSLKDQITEEDIELLYEKVKQLGCDFLQEKLFSLAEDSTFVLFEKYSNLVMERGYFDKEAEEMRKKLKEKDPFNVKKIYLKLAILDFQALANDESVSFDRAVSPLLDYISNFRKKDKENVWKIEMMISQYFFSRGVFDKSLQHARLSYKAAPSSVRKHIAESITYIKQKLKKN